MQHVAYRSIEISCAYPPMGSDGPRDLRFNFAPQTEGGPEADILSAAWTPLGGEPTVIPSMNIAPGYIQFNEGDIPLSTGGTLVVMYASDCSAYAVQVYAGFEAMGGGW